MAVRVVFWFLPNSSLRKEAACGLCFLAAAGFAMEWPQFRGPNHDGVSTDRILKQWPMDGPPVVWRVPLTDGFSSFAVSQDRAFTQVARVLGGTNAEVCVALDAGNGAELWATPVGPAYYPDGGVGDGDGPRSTPTVAGDRVYVLSSWLSLACLNATNGQVLWAKDLLQEYGGSVIPYQNSASPLVDGDIVVCTSAYPIAGAGAVRVTRTNNMFTATQIWRVTPNQLGAQWCTPIPYNGHLYGFFSRHPGPMNLKCAELATGTIKWSQAVSGSGTIFGFANLLLVDGVLLVQGETGELVLVGPNPTQYAELARAKVLSGRCWNILAVSDGRIYARSTTEGVSLDVSVSPLKLFLPPRPANGALEWIVGTANGTPLDSNRAAKVQVRASSSLATPVADWSTLTNSLAWTNGVLRLTNPQGGAGPQRFLIAAEPP